MEPRSTNTQQLRGFRNLVHLAMEWNGVEPEIPQQQGCPGMETDTPLIIPYMWRELNTHLCVLLQVPQKIIKVLPASSFRTLTR